MMCYYALIRDEVDMRCSNFGIVRVQFGRYILTGLCAIEIATHLVSSIEASFTGHFLPCIIVCSSLF
jgi:hypothetical protein